MTLVEQIQKYVKKLPPEKQSEVLNFAAFLQKQVAVSRPARRRSLHNHPALVRGVNAKSTHLHTNKPCALNGLPPVNAVFDTNIVIDALNGIPDADAEFRPLRTRFHQPRDLDGSADRCVG